MALEKSAKKKTKKKDAIDSVLSERLIHYRHGVDDMEMRKNRRNGWDSTINAFMNKLPTPWPYTSKVTDPRIRTTILEKTARLLNSKLQGRVVPREGTDTVKARIMNAMLDFNWDQADNGGSMIEKIARADMYTRLTGASFTLNYWDTVKNCNETKNLDPRDVLFDRTCDHVRNANWVQVREYSTPDELEAKGYNMKGVREKMSDKNGVVRSEHSQVRQNRGLEEDFDDPANPVVEVITEWTRKRGNKPSMRYVFLPKYNEMLDEVENPYKHGQIPVSQLRYYPLGDDIYGESEVEPVVSLQRAINAVLCGFIDTMNLAMRPPIKLLTGETRTDTIVYGPGARWILNNINSGQEVRIGDSAIQAFNNTYPALVAAFNTAMGDQSLGVSNIVGRGADPKTATEVNSLQQQQNSRDQYNQLYLGEFLKDIMIQWVSNIQQYLLDDPTKKYHVLKIIGRDNIKNLQQLGLDQYTQSPEDMDEIKETILAAGGVPNDQLTQILQDTQVPKFPVIKNPTADSAEDYEVARKMELNDMGNEADVYITKDDLDGTFDYIPDVKSMAAGASKAMQEGRKVAFEMLMNDKVTNGLAQDGNRLKWSEVVTTMLEDGGLKDAESLIEPIQGGQGIVDGSQQPIGAAGQAGIQVPPGIPLPNGGLGMAQPQGVQGPAVPQPGVPSQVF